MMNKKLLANCFPISSLYKNGKIYDNDAMGMKGKKKMEVEVVYFDYRFCPLPSSPRPLIVSDHHAPTKFID